MDAYNFVRGCAYTPRARIYPSMGTIPSTVVHQIVRKKNCDKNTTPHKAAYVVTLQLKDKRSVSMEKENDVGLNRLSLQKKRKAFCGSISLTHRRQHLACFLGVAILFPSLRTNSFAFTETKTNAPTKIIANPSSVSTDFVIKQEKAKKNLSVQTDGSNLSVSNTFRLYELFCS